MALAVRAEGRGTGGKLHFFAVVVVEGLALQNMIGLGIAMVLMVADGTAWADRYLGKHIAFAVELRFAEQMLNLDFSLAVGFIFCMDNFACKYCYAAEHDGSMLKVDDAIKAVNLAAGSGEKFVIQFSGGEPLLNFECLKAVVKYVQDNNLPAVLQIQTNGSLMTDEIAQYLFKNKVAIGVSLDGRPNINDKLRLTKAGDGATNSILYGLEVLKRNNIAVGITCVVTDENVSELAGIVEFAYFIGNIRRIGFDLLRGQGRGAVLKPPSETAMRKAMEQVYEKARQLAYLTGYKIHFAQQERVKILCADSSHEFGHCYAMNGEAAFIDAKGDIYACSSLVGNKDFYIGNVKNGLDTILVKKVQEQIRTSMFFCKQCEDFKLCGGGCFARWYGSGVKEAYLSECVLKQVSIKQIKI